MSANAVLQQAVRHARMRWVGAPLLLSGLGVLVWSILWGAAGRGWLSALLGLLGTGLGLASFGANHDTALALALRVRESGGALPDFLARELDAELETDRAGTMGLRPAPRVAMALPFFALAVQAFAAWRLLG